MTESQACLCSRFPRSALRSVVVFRSCSVYSLSLCPPFLCQPRCVCSARPVMADELPQLVAMAEPAAGQPRKRRRQGVMASDLDASSGEVAVVAAHSAEAAPPDDLAEAIAMADQQREPRHHGQRSWQLMQQAQAAKATKALERRLGASQASQASAERSLQAVASFCPAIAKAAGVRVKRGTLDAARAVVATRLAFLAAIRGASVARVTQCVACGLVALVCMMLQVSCVERCFCKRRRRWTIQMRLRSPHCGSPPSVGSGTRCRSASEQSRALGALRQSACRMRGSLSRSWCRAGA